MRTRIAIFCGLAALVLPLEARAVPYQLTHQGRLTDASGTPLDGSHQMSFTLYDKPAGGAALWNESHTLVFEDGYYTVVLGQSSALDTSDFESGAAWLGLAVDAGAELPGRQVITSVPYALIADNAVNLSGGEVDATSIKVNGTQVIDGAGKIDWSVVGEPPSELGRFSCSTDEILLWAGSDWTCSPLAAHDHDGGDITSGTVAIDHLPVGTSAGDVAAGDHGHDAADVTGGVFDVSRLPIGTSTDTVAAGDHVHQNSLETLDCADKEAPLWNDGASKWECKKPAGGGGTVSVQFEFDEASGTKFADTSGYGNDATIPGGGVLAGATGHAGNALSFLGKTATVASGNTIPDSAQVWVEAWIEPALPLSANRTILWKEGAYALRQLGDKIEFTVDAVNGTCKVQHATPVVAGAWAHVSGSYDGLSVIVEVNGLLQAASCAKGPVTPSYGKPLHIGGRLAGSTVSEDYKGTIDEVRVRPFAPANTYGWNSAGTVYTKSCNWRTTNTGTSNPPGQTTCSIPACNTGHVDLGTYTTEDVSLVNYDPWYAWFGTTMGRQVRNCLIPVSIRSTLYTTQCGWHWNTYNGNTHSYTSCTPPGCGTGHVDLGVETRAQTGSTYTQYAQSHDISVVTGVSERRCMISY